MANTVAEYCTGCNQKLKKYTYRVEEDGPFCKACAEFMAYLKNKSVSRQTRIKLGETTKGSG